MCAKCRIERPEQPGILIYGIQHDQPPRTCHKLAIAPTLLLCIPFLTWSMRTGSVKQQEVFVATVSQNNILQTNILPVIVTGRPDFAIFLTDYAPIGEKFFSYGLSHKIPFIRAISQFELNALERYKKKKN